MNLTKFITPALFITLAGNIAMAQIMPWENRRENDDNPFTQSAKQEVCKGHLLLEDVVNGNLVPTRGSGAIDWMKDGERYSRLEPNEATGGMDVVAYRAKDNRREVIIPSSMFIDKSTGNHVPIRSIIWSNDNDKVLVYTNTRRVWRYDTRGDYWVLDLNDGTFRQLGKGLPESSLMFAKFSPDGNNVAYVSQNNIYVENLPTGNIKRITDDGSDTIVNGTFDWVYEEEFGCRDGFRWSPDSKYIAYWQSDTEG
ncbi:DPP IV N-terminal domain-containing protein, partial [uncultured Muribaculum sp.]